MMKKLLILTLVLSLATVANAQLSGVQLSYSGVTNGAGVSTAVDVLVCTEIIIDVHGPANYGFTGYVIIEGNPPNSVEWGDAIGAAAPGFYVKSGYPIKYAGAGDMGGVNARYVETDWGYGYEIVVAQSVGPNTGGLEFDFAFHCSGPGYVTVSLWDDSQGYASAQDTIVLNQQIPEPLTITLLGLGGLLLRRRK